MPSIDARLIFAVLGPLFLLLAAWSYSRAGSLVPQAKTWLIIGIFFSAVAAWLWFGPGHPLEVVAATLVTGQGRFARLGVPRMHPVAVEDAMQTPCQALVPRAERRPVCFGVKSCFFPSTASRHRPRVPLITECASRRLIWWPS
jgi:hypothetical protein